MVNEVILFDEILQRLLPPLGERDDCTIYFPNEFN